MPQETEIVYESVGCPCCPSWTDIEGKVHSHLKPALFCFVTHWYHPFFAIFYSVSFYILLVGLCGDFFIILNPLDEYWGGDRSVLSFWSFGDASWTLHLQEGKKPMPTYLPFGLSIIFAAIWVVLYSGLAWNSTTNFGGQIVSGEQNDNLDGPDMYQFGAKTVPSTTWFCPKYLTIGGFLFNLVWFGLFVFFFLYFSHWYTVPYDSLRNCGEDDFARCGSGGADFGFGFWCRYCRWESGYASSAGSCQFNTGLDLNAECSNDSLWIIPMVFLIVPPIFFVVWFFVSGCIRTRKVPKKLSEEEVEVSLQAASTLKSEESSENLDRSDSSQDDGNDEMDAPENGVALLPLGQSVD